VNAPDLAPLASGRLRARLEKGRSRLVLEADAGRPAAVIDLRPPAPRAAMLAAAGGRWAVTHVEPGDRHRKAHLAVTDAGGGEVATVWPEGARQRIELGSEELVLDAPGLLGRDYRIDGLLAARGAPLVGLRLPVRSRRPLSVEVLPGLAGRRDGSLVLALSTWLVWERLSAGVG
jgi:hypothetical protein